MSTERSLATIVSTAEVMPGVHLIWVRAPGIAAASRPGQFVMARCGQGAAPLLRRPLSIHQVAPKVEAGLPSELALLLAVVGRGTQWLAQAKPGEQLDLLGPLGNGFSIEPSSQNLLLVAGGIGIAPLVALACDALAIGRSVTLLLGAATASALYPRHLLPPGLETVIATEDGSAGRRGMVTDLLPRLWGGADQVFACGPISMYRAILAQSQGLSQGKRVQVSLEVRMGCGLGACYGCAIRTKQGMKLVCRDGPVFELGEVIWEEVEI